MFNAKGSQRKSIVVFGAHPDDVEIGMAGTISRLAAAGNDVFVCVASIPCDRERRMAETREAARIMGVKDVIFMAIKAPELGYNRRTIGAIDSIVRSLEPHSIFTHWVEDSHQDHVNLTRCVIAATRKNHFNVYMYEQTIPGGITPAAFRAQYLVDVSGFVDQKMESIRAHASQIEHNGDWWMEGIRGRAMYRGYQMHSRYAEAFEVIKISNDTNLFNNEQRPARAPLRTVEDLMASADF
jgi:LmbE family N-acetylglucosaminyl deacetylase